MKLFQATIVVALLASSSAASGKKSRNDSVSKLSSRIADTLRSSIFPPPDFAFGGGVRESVAATSRAKRSPERRIQVISDVCWDESNELLEGGAAGELLAVWDDCEIDGDTGSTTCSGDYADLEAFCTADGGQVVYLNFSFECADDFGTYLVDYSNFPDCIGLSCDEGDVAVMAENWALTESENYHSDASCGNFMATGGETMDEEKDPGDTMDEEEGPAETETATPIEGTDPEETETEEDDTCYEETDAMNSNADMVQELSSAVQLCEPDFGEDFVTVNCGSTPELDGLCEDFGGRAIMLDLEFMCSNPAMGFDDTIPVSYIDYPLCTLCGSETDDSFEASLEVIVLEEFLLPQGFVCDIADSDNVGAMASDTSTGSATSVAYMTIVPLVLITIGFNILSF